MKKTGMQVFLSGLRRKCPSCGTGRIFAGYLKLEEECPNCQIPIGEIRADDFPPYLTILIVGHIIIPALLFSEAKWHPPSWVQMTIWPTAAVLLALLLLPRIKGVVVGMMWQLGLKGDEQR